MFLPSPLKVIEKVPLADVGSGQA